MRLAIEHLSRYHYRSVVSSSYNEARMTPMNSGGQFVLSSSVHTQPYSSVFEYVDYFGTVVSAFDIHESHRTLEVKATSLVETSKRNIEVAEVTWEYLESDEVASPLCEYLGSSYYINEDELIREISRDLRSKNTPVEFVYAVASYIQSNLLYQPGSTSVTTPAIDALVGKAGVCQDFAHLMISLCRSAGVPTRYVSGYLYPVLEAKVGERSLGESHAWVEVFLGRWHPIDPTNSLAVDSHHVVLGRGRDYSDIRPLHGIYQGGDLESLEIEVSFTLMSL